MQCVVHIGTEKTGSTSIQSAMEDHASLLEQQKLYLVRKCGYPNNMLLPKSLVISGTHVKSSSTAVTPDDRFDPEKILTDTKKEIEQARALGYRTLIISSELFHSKFTDIGHIESLREFLKNCGITEIKIIVYLRPQIDLAVSRYSTAMRTGHTVNRGLPTATPGHHYFDYQSMLEKWATTFGRSAVVPRIFDKTELFGGCVVKDFISKVSPPLINQITPEKAAKNKELSLNEHQILSSVNSTLKKLNIDENQERILRRKLIAQLDIVSPEYSNQKINLPPHAEATNFQNTFEKSNNKIARSWFQRNELFNLDFSKYQQQRQEPSQQELFDQFQEAVVPILIDQLNEVEFLKDRSNRLKKQYSRLKKAALECVNF